MSTEDDQSLQDTAVNMEALPEEVSPEQLPAKLDQLRASATKEYSLKNYNAAAEYYSEAAEVQDLINGEMSLENADLLYQYGRCLYHVAIANSDVLGGKVASAEEPKRKKRKTKKTAESSSAANGEGSSSIIGDAIRSSEQKLAEEFVEAAVEQKDETKEEVKQTTSDKPYFQIMGDENWTDSEGEDDDGDDAEDGEGDAEEEEDDFATAYEILDMARVLLSRKLEAVQYSSEKGKGKGTEERSDVRQLRERLADTHDLQAEISLENERFNDAINDTRDSLAMKIQLYPEESSLIAEAHFKLSLALEFASVTSTQEDAKGESQVAQVDEAMRGDAAKEMELALASCRARIAKETAALSGHEGAKLEEAKRQIEDVKEMVQDMEQRLDDLRKPAASLSAMQGLGPAGAPSSEEAAMRGVLGSLLGESKAEQAKRIQEVTAQANDLSGMVKKKKAKPAPAAAAPVVEGKGKRKAEDGDAIESDASNGKKVKFAETTQELAPANGA